MRGFPAGTLLLCALGTACQKGTSGGPAEDPHGSPEAAAHCQAAAFKARSPEGFLECVHPDLRDSFRKELDEVERKGPEFWIEGATKMAPLEKAKASDFQIEPIPAGQESYGDQLASYRFAEHGKIEVVRKDGKWYVVDPD
jgi:hypothetical protein